MVDSEFGDPERVDLGGDAAAEPGPATDPNNDQISGGSPAPVSTTAADPPLEGAATFSTAQTAALQAAIQSAVQSSVKGIVAELLPAVVTPIVEQLGALRVEGKIERELPGEDEEPSGPFSPLYLEDNPYYDPPHATVNPDKFARPQRYRLVDDEAFRLLTAAGQKSSVHEYG